MKNKIIIVGLIIVLLLSLSIVSINTTNLINENSKIFDNNVVEGYRGGYSIGGAIVSHEIRQSTHKSKPNSSPKTQQTKSKTNVYVIIIIIILAVGIQFALSIMEQSAEKIIKISSKYVKS